MVARRPGLGQVQIWQDTRGRLLFKIVKRDSDHPTAEDLEFLYNQTRLYLGEDVKIEHAFVDSLPIGASGKVLVSRSSVACDFVDIQGEKRNDLEDS